MLLNLHTMKPLGPEPPASAFVLHRPEVILLLPDLGEFGYENVGLILEPASKELNFAISVYYLPLSVRTREMTAARKNGRSSCEEWLRTVEISLIPNDVVTLTLQILESSDAENASFAGAVPTPLYGV